MILGTKYSDNGVDDFIAPHLPDFGYALEIGASNGKTGSNCKAFEDCGWVVLCVEPNPLLEGEGRACRKLWRQVACGAEDMESHELLVFDPYPYGSISGLEKRYPWGDSPSHKFQVAVRRADRLLEEVGFPRVDLLTIDCEGYEKEVLSGFDIERWKPTIIVTEDASLVFDGYERMEPPSGYVQIGGAFYADRVFLRKGQE